MLSHTIEGRVEPVAARCARLMALNCSRSGAADASPCASADRRPRAMPRRCARPLARRVDASTSTPACRSQPPAASPSGWRPRSYVETAEAPLFHVILAVDAGHRILRPPARAVHDFFFTGSGALQLLRMRAFLISLHGGAGRLRRVGAFPMPMPHQRRTRQRLGARRLSAAHRRSVAGSIRSALIGGIIIALDM